MALFRKELSEEDKHAFYKARYAQADETEKELFKASKSFRKRYRVQLWSWHIRIMRLGAYFPKWKATESLAFLRRWLELYFFDTGAAYYTTDRFVDTPDPKLIFMPRSIGIESLFAFHVFQNPIIIPAGDGLLKLSIYHKSKKTIGPFLNYVSYPDHHLEQLDILIDHLIQEGYTVLAYLNPIPTNPYFQKNIILYEALKKYVDREDAYLLDCEGISDFPRLKNPGYLKCDMQKLTDLFEHFNAETTPQKFEAIAGFYGYQDFEMEQTP